MSHWLIPMSSLTPVTIAIPVTLQVTFELESVRSLTLFVRIILDFRDPLGSCMNFRLNVI